MTKKQLEAENDTLVDTLEEVRDRLRQLQEIVGEALDDEDEEEE